MFAAGAFAELPFAGAPGGTSAPVDNTPTRRLTTRRGPVTIIDATEATTSTISRVTASATTRRPVAVGIRRTTTTTTTTRHPSMTTRRRSTT